MHLTKNPCAGQQPHLYGVTITFDSSHDEALHKVLLQPRIDQQHGDRGDDDLRTVERQAGDFHLGHNFLRSQSHEGCGAHFSRKRVDVGLQGQLGRAVDINAASEIVVPMADDTQKRNRRDGGHGQRHNDFQKRIQWVRAVDQRRFLQLFGQALHEVHQHDDIVNLNGPRQRQRPHGVDHAHILNPDIGCDQTAVEEHGEHHQPHIDIAGAKHTLRAGERIGA